MTRMIILSDVDAERVRGPSEIDPLSALDPVPVPGGLWMLPLAVLADPAHERFREFLEGLPQEDIPLRVEEETETEIGFGKPKSVLRRGRSAPDE